MTRGPLEPDVEEVGQLRVHDVVVVRRVHDDDVDGTVLDVIEVVARLAGYGDGRRIRGRSPLDGSEKTAGCVGALRVDQGDEFTDALGGLLYRPVIPNAGGQGSHLRVRPHECEVVTVEDGAHAPGRVVPAPGAIVVVQQGVQRQRKISVGRPMKLVQAARRYVGIQHFAEDFGADAVAEELSGREHVDPPIHAVESVPAIIVRGLTDGLAGHDVERLPFRQLVGELLGDLRRGCRPRPVALGSNGPISRGPGPSSFSSRTRSL